MWGAIIGDIVGSRFENVNCCQKDFSFFSTWCRFTDDTLMTLAVAEALLKAGRSDEGTLKAETIRCMQAMGEKYPHAGWGDSFARWLREKDPKPYQSLGNGAAMRVSPIGEYARSEEEVKRLSRIITGVSHDHPEGIKARSVSPCACILQKTARRKRRSSRG